MEQERNKQYKKLTFDRVKKELKRSIRLHENCIIAWKRKTAESEHELEKYQTKLDELRTDNSLPNEEFLAKWTKNS
jgi:predicted DNA binding CopG/RHH family protein